MKLENIKAILRLAQANDRLTIIDTYCGEWNITKIQQLY